MKGCLGGKKSAKYEIPRKTNTVETLFLKLVTKISGFSGKFATFGGHTLNGFDVILLFSARRGGGGGGDLQNPSGPNRVKQLYGTSQA